jgi:hypothetical protein
MATWYVAPSLEQLLREVNARWPNRDKTSDGALGNLSHQATKSDHNPDWDDGGVVRARDVDEDLQGSSTPYPHFQTGRGADPLFQELLARCRSGAEKRVAYLIYEGKIYSATYGWVANDYFGANFHGHHLHVSIKHGDIYENDRSEWLPNEEEDMALSDADIEKVADAVMAKIRNEDIQPGPGEHSLSWYVRNTYSEAKNARVAVETLDSELPGDPVTPA